MSRMKKTLIVGNWKMHLNVHEASILVHRLSERIRTHRDIEVVLAPGFVGLQPIHLQMDHRKFKLAAQNAYHQDEGAYTGEISFNMLRGLVDYVIVGHSDRRYKFGETLEMIRDKTAAAFRNDITPILCVGETKQERIDRETSQVLHDQVVSALSALTEDEVQNMVIAYEPIWALSNGKDFANHEIPTPEVIAKATSVIRNNIRHLYGKEVAENVRVLYGGSTSASTAYGLLAAEGVDGLLVGGASLNYHEFSGIADAAYRFIHRADSNGQDG
jgi:triosephosphate isomerase (TIM)